jgi:alkanesulfonate monooxygenase SsuD/methylene tetrahydromethanopterin reductase-like flavin-dependent oxidoreductase (luciferase family)
VLFEEKVELFVELLEEQPVTWEGTTRAALQDADVFPKTESGRLDTWVGVGGSPESVMRAAKYGLPMVLAIIGGDPRRFRPFVEGYAMAAQEAGHTPHPVAMHSPGFVADTDEEAKAIHYAPYKVMRDRIGAERGWPRLNPGAYEQDIRLGSLYVGSPETVAQKMATYIKDLGVGRFDLIYTAGPQPTDARLRCVELYGSQVVPRVRELLAE